MCSKESKNLHHIIKTFCSTHPTHSTLLHNPPSLTLIPFQDRQHSVSPLTTTRKQLTNPLQPRIPILVLSLFFTT
jgi:hypothetical protein